MSQLAPYTSGQVARMFNVGTSTVARWADEGLIPYFKTPGGQRRYPRSDIDALVAA